MASPAGRDADFAAVQAVSGHHGDKKKSTLTIAHPRLVDAQISVDQCWLQRTFSADASDYPFAVSMTVADSIVMSVRGRSFGPHGVLPISSTTA